MNKSEILQDVQSKPFVFQVYELKFISETLNIKEYEQGFYESNGNAGKDRSIRIQVLNEGTENEVAFYKDKVIEATI